MREEEMRKKENIEEEKRNRKVDMNSNEDDIQMQTVDNSSEYTLSPQTVEGQSESKLNSDSHEEDMQMHILAESTVKCVFGKDATLGPFKRCAPEPTSFTLQPNELESFHSLRVKGSKYFKRFGAFFPRFC